MPEWLHVLAIVFLLLGFASAIVVAVDVMRNPQHMGIMNIVWPVTALFGTVATLWFYFRHGRAARRPMRRAGDRPPFPISVATGTTHCGAGCALGDIVAEWLAFLVPGVAVWFGWHTIFADKMFAVWVLDYLLAFGLGIAFQYFAIAPMRGLALGDGLRAAVKADFFSLTAWQVGMYGFMAIAQFYLGPRLAGARFEVDTPEFWFMMQIAMIAGFATSYPVNWWLIRSGVKERM